jgi:hypothetical protein
MLGTQTPETNFFQMVTTVKLFSSKDDISQLFQVLQFEDISFHPDKSFDDYSNPMTGQKRYSEREVHLRRELLLAAREYCTANRINIYRLYKDTCLKVDLKAKLNEYLPVLFELLDNKPFSWAKINDQFSTTHLTRLTNYFNGDRKPIEVNFYDVISESLNGNASGTRMLTFFRNLLEELSIALEKQGKKMIRETLYNLLIEPDLNYLNYIGELAVLNLFVRKHKCELLEIASPLGNGNDADFRLRDVTTGATYFIDVVNIRPRNFPTGPETLKMLIEGKLNEKNEKKTKGDPAYLTFRLLPVIWGTSNELRWTADLLKRGLHFDVSNVTDPCAFCSFSDDLRGGTLHRFGSLHSLFP